MGFNPNIPLVTDPTLQSGKQIRSNFQSIASAFAENHSSLTANTDFSGNHTVLTMLPIKAPAVPPVTDANQVAIYNKIVGGPATPELFFKPNNNQTEIQLTFPTMKVDNTDDQYTFMAGPFIVFAGNFISTSQNQLVTLVSATTLVYVGLMFTGGLASGLPINVVGNSFNVHRTQNPSPNQRVYYIAIGI
jgi:hypothetical protein